MLANRNTNFKARIVAIYYVTLHKELHEVDLGINDGVYFFLWRYSIVTSTEFSIA